MTTVSLSHNDFNNAGGKIYPASGWGVLNSASPVCPSTAYDGFAHYFKLDSTGVRYGKRFKAWTKSWQDLKGYVHTGGFNPYKGGHEVTEREFGGSELFQVASTVKTQSRYYQFRVVPDCTYSSKFTVRRSSPVRPLSIIYPYLTTLDCRSSTTSRGYADFYTLNVESTTYVTIELSSSDFDTYLYLRGGEEEQSANEITRNDDIGYPNVNSRITWRLAPGWYTIEVTSWGISETGRYSLSVGSSPTLTPTPTPTATPTPTPTPTATPTPTPTPTPTQPSTNTSPWQYDTNGNGVIDQDEALNAIVDYFNGLITKELVIAVIALYFSP